MTPEEEKFLFGNLANPQQAPVQQTAPQPVVQQPTPQPVVQQQPVAQQPQTLSQPNVAALAQQAASAQQALNQANPAPQAPSAVNSLGQNIGGANFWNIAGALGGILGTAALANQLFSKNTGINGQEQVINGRIEPTMAPATDTGFNSPAGQNVPAPSETVSPEQKMVQEHVEGVKKEIGKGSVPAVPPKVKANEVESIVRSEANKHANEQEALKKAEHHTHANPFENVEHELTGTGFPAYRGTGKGEVRKKEMKSLAELGSDLMFVPGGQSMDIVRNAVGQEEYTKNLKKFGGYPVNPKEAYSQSREINKSLGREARETAKAAGTDLGEVTPAITKKVGGSKLVKIGGVAGALISAADLASAKNIPEAALRATDIATDYIPGVRQFKQGMAPKEAGAPVVPPQMFANAAKLGSPYYNTEWAKNERKKAK